MNIKRKAIPLIYNLFPRHFGKMDEWSSLLPHVVTMGFNAIFVNPFHETGFSGSLYAVKDYYRLNPLFLPEGADPANFAPLDAFIAACDAQGLTCIIDLVINHTAIDSVLIKQHPDWYKRDKKGKIVSPFAVDPSDPSNVTVWGDLATIDNENSPDRQSLWQYWDELIAFFQKKGVSGFRCDAAYQVPADLWQFLIAAAKQRDSRATFYAETLGCSPDQIEALEPAAFDYLFNSSKWWNFDASWALDQHAANKVIAPSVAFPESHDTERLAHEGVGTKAQQQNRYCVAALFSTGCMMPMGYEYGAVTRMDVVKGTIADVDLAQWDLSAWVGAVNRLKLQIPVLAEEGTWRALSPYNLKYLFLEKASDKGNDTVYICINKRLDAEVVIEEWMVPKAMKNLKYVYSLLAEEITPEPIPEAFTLDVADVVLFTR